MNLTQATGRVSSLLVDIVASPSGPVSNPPIAIYCHSAVNAPQEASGSVLPDMIRVTRSLVSQGFVIVAPSAPSSYGNNDALAAVDAGVQYAIDKYGAKLRDGITMYGTSMGTLSIQRYIMDGTHPVRRAALFLQVTDLVACYDLPQFQGPVGTAWGETYPDPLPAEADLLTRSTELASVPILSNYASDDVLTTVGLTTWLANSGATAHDRGALGHTNAVIAASDMTEIAEFVRF